MDTTSIPNDWDLQQQQAERRRRFAEALQAQGQDMGPAGQMVSGWYVPTNPLNYLSKALSGVMGAYMGSKVDQNEKDMAKQRRDAFANTISDFSTALQGKPQQVLPDSVAGPPAPAVPGDRNAALAALLRNPDTAGMALQEQLKQLAANPNDAFAKINPHDYTPESIAQFSQTKNYGSLVPVRKNEVGPSGQVWNPYQTQAGTIMPDVNKPFMLGPGGTPVPNKAYQDYTAANARASAPNISIKNDVKTGESLAKEVGPMMMNSRAAAQGAIQQADVANRIDQAISSGKIFAGPGANQRLTMAQLGEVLNVNGKDTSEKLSNTRTVIQGLAQFSLTGRGALKGQGQISDYEGKLLAKATSGDIADLTVPELKVISNTAKRVAKAQYAEHQRNMQVMKSRPDLQGLSEFYSVPDMPSTQDAAQQPQGVKFLGFE